MKYWMQLVFHALRYHQLSKLEFSAIELFSNEIHRFVWFFTYLVTVIVSFESCQYDFSVIISDRIHWKMSNWGEKCFENISFRSNNTPTFQYLKRVEHSHILLENFTKESIRICQFVVSLVSPIRQLFNLHKKIHTWTHYLLSTFFFVQFFISYLSIVGRIQM